MNFNLSYKLAAFALVAGLGLSFSAKADTIGNPAVIGTTVDGCNNCAYVLPTAFNGAGQTVKSYSFYALQAGDITPFLLNGVTNNNGTKTFTVIGIGQSRSVGTTGVKTFSFGSFTGTDLTTGSTYFGFENMNMATVAFSRPAGSGIFLYGSNVALGTTFTEQYTSGHFNSQNDYNERLYSINASATPEPSSLALLGTGLAGLGGLVKRRFKRA